MKQSFVNLHHHDEYSIRDGLGTVGDLIPVLQSHGSSYCAITNHGSIGGWVKQYSACGDAGIKPIFGMEGYVNNYRGDDPDERKKNRSNNHLILLAKNETGFYNIIRIHNDAQLNGFYYKPRINHEAIQKWGEGIIGSSACFAGEISTLLMAGNDEEAERVYKLYRDSFDEFYIELTMIEMYDQIRLNEMLIQFAQRMGAPIIVSTDAHYIYPEHCETHDLLLLIKSRKTILDKIENPEEVWQFDARNLYYRFAPEMWDLWRDGFTIPSKRDPSKTLRVKYESDVFTEDVMREAMLNTVRIAVSCENIELDSSLKLPQLYDDGERILRAKAITGLQKRGLDGIPEYEERLAFELDMICKKDYADYFLVVDKITQDAVEKFGEFATGYGRGCFHPTTRVVMGDGMTKFIPDVGVGDIVVSHDGSKQEVLDTFEYDVDEDLIEIETDDGRIVRCTPDHKIFAWVDGEMTEKRADELEDGDDIVEAA